MTRWPSADTYRRRPLRPKNDIRSLASLSVFDCDPSSKVAPPPEAFDLLEPCFAQQILVPSGRDRNKHALEGEAFALDLFGGIPVHCLQCVVAASEQFLEA